MNPIFKICKNSPCGISITGLEQDDKQYSNVLAIDKYRYEDCVTINIMIPLNSAQEEGTYTYSIDLHDNEIDETTMEFPKDGLYKIIHLIIPTQKWLDEYNLEFPEFVYIFDSGNIYKILKGQKIEVDIQEILNLNAKSTVYFDSQYTFCTCRLQECFYKFCREYFAKLCSNKCIKENISERDILWMGINTIKYLLDLGKYYEAQGVLESLTGCAGLCKQTINVKGNGYGCGCSN